MYIALLGIVIFIIGLYRILANTPQNNLRKAKIYHKKGEDHYTKGHIEKARLFFEVASVYRELALDKMEA
ncbi:MAG: hypothetical protein NDI94_02910 [Candidatus Woesearchaeota archaeon]|jgi:hypothetical protein|nr:hypothetical protein [Candidatus Woesearchaeota archaeon]